MRVLSSNLSFNGGAWSIAATAATTCTTRTLFVCTSASSGTSRHQLKKLTRRQSAASGAPNLPAIHFELPSLPYPSAALEPYISREALEHHWNIHQGSHVLSLNSLAVTRPESDDHDGAAITEEASCLNPQLLRLMLYCYNHGNPFPSFFHSAQIWNHDFFWRSMHPSSEGGSGEPSGKLMELIQRDFGSFPCMIQQLNHAASTLFGSGWVWLCYKANRISVGNATNPRPSEDDHKLFISKTPNAVNPLLWDYFPLLAIDVWEHAYYLDYQNRRMDYVSVFLDKLVSWETAGTRLTDAIEQVEQRAKEDMKKDGRATEKIEERPVEMYLEKDDEEGNMST